MTVCKERAIIDSHFEGSVSPADERAMREHVPSCKECHGYYERRLLLCKLDPEGLSSERRLARGLGLAERRPMARAIPIGVVTLFAAAAALLLWVRTGPEPLGFTARGAPMVDDTESRVFVYDVRPGEPAVLARDSIGRRDELAFAYENRAAKHRLMIFGVDEHHHVYWFFPAWTVETENPVAIPIETDARRHELPEAMRHDLDGSRLEIRAVFLDSPISVREVESLVHDHPVGPLPIERAVQSSTVYSTAYPLAPSP
jgi:hypothetical protein